MQHFKFVNWRIRGFVFWCHEQVKYIFSFSLVEIDCLTGDHVVLRTDIVMDLGESINPAIDIGQIEGAFAQGYGLFMLEQMIHSPDGVLLTRGPGSYKLPGKKQKTKVKALQSHIQNFWQLLSFEFFYKYCHLDFLVNQKFTLWCCNAEKVDQDHSA